MTIDELIGRLDTLRARLGGGTAVLAAWDGDLWPVVGAEETGPGEVVDPPAVILSLGDDGEEEEGGPTR